MLVGENWRVVHAFPGVTAELGGVGEEEGEKEEGLHQQEQDQVRGVGFWASLRAADRVQEKPRQVEAEGPACGAHHLGSRRAVRTLL